jgi:hypothetical protein
MPQTGSSRFIVVLHIGNGSGYLFTQFRRLLAQITAMPSVRFQGSHCEEALGEPAEG